MNKGTVSLSNISIQKLTSYLSEKGWIKIKETKDFFSLWTFKEEKVLVPLNLNFADFQSRLLDVLFALEKIEDRPLEEIITSLTKASDVARKLEREVLELKIMSIHDNRHEVSADKLGGVFQALKKFLNSFDGSLGTNDLEVSLVDTFPGSFGVRLAISNETKVSQLNLLDTRKPEEIIIEHLLYLIQFGNGEDKKKLLDTLNSLNKKTVKMFKRLTRELITLESNISLEWGSLESQEIYSSDITFDHLIESLEKLNEFDDSEIETIEVVGRLEMGGIGNNKRTRRFTIKPTTGKKPYTGEISEHLLRKLDYNLVVGENYIATIEKELQINSSTGDREETHTLIDLKGV